MKATDTSPAEVLDDNNFQPGTSKEGPFELQKFPVEFFGFRLSEFLILPVGDVLSNCQQSLSKLEMSKLGEIWASDNSYPVVREFFRRLTEKGKQAQDSFFWSLVAAFNTVNTSATRNISIVLLEARNTVMKPCSGKVVDIVASQKSSFKRWERLARELEIEDELIDAIKVEETDDYERTRLALRKWRERKGRDATTRDIMFALTRLGCAEVNLIIMEKLCLIPIGRSSNIR